MSEKIKILLIVAVVTVAVVDGQRGSYAGNTPIYHNRVSDEEYAANYRPSGLFENRLGQDQPYNYNGFAPPQYVQGYRPQAFYQNPYNFLYQPNPYSGLQLPLYAPLYPQFQNFR